MEKSDQGIVEPAGKFVSVIESAFTVSAKIHCLLECRTGMLPAGTKLPNEKGQCRTVMENNLVFGSEQEAALQQKIKDNNWYLYRLESLTGSLKGRRHRPSCVSMNEMIGHADQDAPLFTFFAFYTRSDSTTIINIVYRLL